MGVLPQELKSRILENGANKNDDLYNEIYTYGNKGIIEAIIVTHGMIHFLKQHNNFDIAVEVIKGLTEEGLREEKQSQAFKKEKVQEKIHLYLTHFNDSIKDRLTDIANIEDNARRLNKCNQIQPRVGQPVNTNLNKQVNEFEKGQAQDDLHNEEPASPNALIQFAVNNPWLTAAIVGMIAVSVVALTFATVPSAAAMATSFGRFLGASASHAYATGATTISGGAGVLAAGITFFALQGNKPHPGQAGQAAPEMILELDLA